MKKVKGFLVLALAAVGTLLTACDDGLGVKQAYAFRLETMPVQTRIARGETAEIRCMLVREGEYDGARYTIRYFQPDGKGELRMDDGTLFLPPMTATRSRKRCFGCTTPPRRRISRPSTSMSKITSGNANSYRSCSTTKMKRKTK